MKLVDLSIKKPVFITMIAAFVAVVGFLALKKLPIDLYPSVSYPVIGVRANLEGAAPEEIEQMITKKMEDTLSTLAGIKSMRSSSGEGRSMVGLEFDIGADIRFQEIQARAKIANIRKSLPADMSEPVIYRQDPDDQPILEIAVVGNRSASELSDIAENVVIKKILQIEGVGDVTISGNRNPEVKVNLKPDILDAWKINATDVVTAIQKSNRNDPIGYIYGKDASWMTRAVAQANTVKDLQQLSVAKSPLGAPIFLRDIAEVKNGYIEVERISRIHDENGKLNPTVIIGVLKQSGENTVSISDKIRKAIIQIQEDLPPGVQLKIARDNADLIRKNVADVFDSLIIAVLLTVMVVLLFLQSYRSTLTTGFALPSSIIATFMVIYFAGFTINVMTLLALSLSIGLLVDDAIVVRENIYRHLRTGKLTGKAAAFTGASEVGLAVIATTSTLVAVFLPVGFMGGLTGQFFKSFALTVVFAMLVSLWDSLTMAPMLSAYYANIADPAKEWEVFGWPGRQFYKFLCLFERAFIKVEHAYSAILKFIIPKWWLALLITVVSIYAAYWGFANVKKTFLPTQLDSTFSINLEGPLGISLEKAMAVADIVDKRIADTGQFDWWTITTDSGTGDQAGVALTVRTKAQFSGNQNSLGQVRQKVRKVLQGIPGYNLRISEPADPLAGAGRRFQPIAVSITGDDIVQIKKTALEVKKVMQQVSGIIDISAIKENGLPEIRFITNPILSAKYDITPAQVAANLSLWITGDTSNRLRVGDNQIPINVRLADFQYLPPAQILQRNIYIKGSGQNKGELAVPLSNFVHAETGSGPQTIARENRQRIMRVGANLDRNATLGAVVTELKTKLKGLLLPAGYTATVVGQNEQMAEATTNIVWAIILGSIFIYMVLASLFESFIIPLTVMSAIPLAATGAVLALIMFDIPLDLYGGIGMILLAGIVAKNSILLVDFANKLVRDNNETAVNAVIIASPMRLRPILMTSIAMIAGMIPIAIGMGATGEARRALGIATIGGVISSTILTLLIVPNLFIVMEKFRELFVSKKD